MANAKFSDALQGYRFYLDRRGDANIAEVNEYLKRKGATHVSPRTYGHYAKLLARGFTSYIPINQFDVLLTIGRLRSASDRRKHTRRPVSDSFSISIAGGAWLSGKVIDASEVGLGVVIRSQHTLPRGSIGLVRIADHEEFLANVVWSRPKGRTLRAGLRAFQHISAYSEDRAIDMGARGGKFVLARTSEGELPWARFYSILSRTDELIAAVKDLRIALWAAGHSHVDVADPILRRINFASPGSFELKIDLGVEGLLRLILDKVQFWGLQKREMRAKVRSLELGNELQQLEAVRNAFDLGRTIQNTPLAVELSEELRSLAITIMPGTKIPKGLFAPGTPEMAILEKRILPAALDMLAGDDLGYEATTSDAGGIDPSTALGSEHRKRSARGNTDPPLLGDGHEE